MSFIAQTELRVARLARVFLYLVCAFQQFVDLSRAGCSNMNNMQECKVNIHNSVKRKNILLCVKDSGYHLNALALLETECDGIHEYVQSGINDTYNCTLLSSTRGARVDDQPCAELMVIECVRTVPVITTTEVNRRDDAGDNSDGGEGGSDDGAVGARAFGRGIDDDDDDDDLVLGIELQRNGTNETPCNIFIHISMKELGK